jgi:hypothetical protein
MFAIMFLFILELYFFMKKARNVKIDFFICFILDILNIISEYINHNQFTTRITNKIVSGEVKFSLRTAESRHFSSKKMVLNCDHL